MKMILRYRTAKPADGHFSFQLEGGAMVLSYNENWHTEKGWEINLDVLEDSRQLRDRRYFFICNAGDDLGFLGDYPDSYFVGVHRDKAYSSYLFETTHLSETERKKGRIDNRRYTRSKPHLNELSRTVQKLELGARATGKATTTRGVTT